MRAGYDLSKNRWMYKSNLRTMLWMNKSTQGNQLRRSWEKSWSLGNMKRKCACNSAISLKAWSKNIRSNLAVIGKNLSSEIRHQMCINPLLLSTDVKQLLKWENGFWIENAREWIVDVSCRRRKLVWKKEGKRSVLHNVNIIVYKGDVAIFFLSAYPLSRFLTIK